MIRYYETIGLIVPAERAVSGYRVYSAAEVSTLRFIRRARDLNFSVEQIKDLLGLWVDRNRASADVKRLALRHVEELETRMRQLQEMATTLRDLADHCHGDDRPDCPIIRDLAAASDPAIPFDQGPQGLRRDHRPQDPLTFQRWEAPSSRHRTDGARHVEAESRRDELRPLRLHGPEGCEVRRSGC